MQQQSALVDRPKQEQVNGSFIPAPSQNNTQQHHHLNINGIPGASTAHQTMPGAANKQNFASASPALSELPKASVVQALDSPVKNAQVLFSRFD